jgi:hypothetical protein
MKQYLSTALDELNRKTKATPFALAQQMLLSKEGILLDIGNGILFNAPIQHKNPFFPLFFESIFAILLDIELGDDDIVFPRVHGEGGCFDFRFCKMIYQNEIAIAWTISAVSDLEALLLQQQQRNNELILTQ